ncbi:hypothetical protein H0H93_004229 [Arthromyces matolae]|nr:hypothetical protein H0H93_004229 [Arthromyces matolae]
MKLAHQSIQVSENQNKFHAPPHPIKSPKMVIKSWVLPLGSFLFHELRREGPLPYKQIPRNLARLVYKDVRHPIYSSVPYPYKYEGNAIVYIVGVEYNPLVFGDKMDERWSWAKTHDDQSGHGTACAYLVTLVARGAKIIPVKVNSGKQTHILAGLDFVLRNCEKHQDQHCIVSMSIGILEADDTQTEHITSDEDVALGQTFEDEDKVVKNGMIEAKFQEV